MEPSTNVIALDQPELQAVDTTVESRSVQFKGESGPNTNCSQLRTADAVEESDDAAAFSGTSLDPIGGFSDPAKACIAKAGWIAYVLNHARMNAAHLILAMSLDKKAAHGLKSRGLDVEQLRRDMMEMVLNAKWDYTDDQAEKRPVISTTSDLSDILDAAKRRAAERDNQPAALTDLFDVLVVLNAEGKLVPPKPQVRDSAAITSGFAHVSDSVTQVLSKLGELQIVVDQGLRANTAHFDAAMSAATSELLAKLARSEPEPEIVTPSEPTGGATPQNTGWKMPFRIALLGLL